MAGLLSLPVVPAFGRLSHRGCASRARAMLSVATPLFLFDQGFTIYGGNITSIWRASSPSRSR
ncbi:MAG: hypothetical protein H6518_13660 [Microthrixaceae bacterium]|nr:hypothetical protein [Microthrixaceae bacterium]